MANPQQERHGTRRAKVNLQLRSADNQGVSSLDPLDGIADQLVNDGPGGLLLVDDGAGLAHQEWSGILHHLIGNIVTEGLEVVLDWDDALAGKLLDLLLAVLLPVSDVLVVADTERSASEDDGSDIVVEAGGADGFLVSLGSAGLIGQDETGADPDGGGAQHERSGDGLAIVDTASGDDLDRSAGQRRLVALDKVDAGWDENGGLWISVSL